MFDGFVIHFLMTVIQINFYRESMYMVCAHLCTQITQNKLLLTKLEFSALYTCCSLWYL